MPKPLQVLDRSFRSQKAAEVYFYGVRDKYLANGGDITDSAEFDLLCELYIKYCECTNWPLPASPVAFYVRNIARGVGARGGTTQGFVVKLKDGSEKEFSAQKAISAVASQQRLDALGKGV